MNKRISELYKQAWVPGTAIDPSNNMPYDTKYFSAKKFADLIVRECMNCCDLVEKVEWIEPPNYELGVKACKVKIQTHFGIDEQNGK